MHTAPFLLCKYCAMRWKQPLSVHMAERAHALLLEDRREEELVGSREGVAAFIGQHQPVGQRGSTARVRDDEDWGAHLDPTKGGEEPLVESQAHEVEDAPDE